MSFIVVGESLIDMIPESNGDYKACAGGAPYNVALAMGRLDAKVYFLGKISNDEYGKILEDNLGASNVLKDLIVKDDAPTSKAWVSFDNDKVEYRFDFEGTADRKLCLSDFPSNLPSDVLGIHFSFGAITMDYSPTATDMKTFAKKHYSEKIISLDPNLRPLLIKDSQEYRKVFEGWLSHVHILKMSEEDLEFLYGDLSIDSVASFWQEQGVKIVIITQSGKGLSFWLDGEKTFVPANKVELVDAVGAGDCFTGGFLSSLCKEKTSLLKIPSISKEKMVAHCLFGQKVAGLNCQKKGCNPPYLIEVNC